MSLFGTLASLSSPSASVGGSRAATGSRAGGAGALDMVSADTFGGDATYQAQPLPDDEGQTNLCFLSGSRVAPGVF